MNSLPAFLIPSLSAASYPFFDCVSCGVRVQMAIECSAAGRIPLAVVGNRFVRLSSEFDRGDFTLHCRGQGERYSRPDSFSATAFLGHAEQGHYNFSGFFKGACCFCVLHGGFGSELFVTSACFHCRRKEMLRSEFVKLYMTKGETAWRTHRWSALPSAVLDKILRLVLGVGERAPLVVTDGTAVVDWGVLGRTDG